MNFFGDLLVERRANPTEDIISDVATAEVNDEELNDAEMLDASTISSSG